MADEVMVIFTGKSLEQCFEVGGTQSWVLSPAHARRCKYAILCQNAYAEGDWAEGKEPHGKAFMIGRISDVVRSAEDPGKRWLVKFDEYARLDMPNFWQGWRNPVRYTTLEELSLSLDNVRFEPMPEAAEPRNTEPKPPQKPTGGLTIDEAKKALAAKFGVKPEAVEIIIRG